MPSSPSAAASSVANSRITGRQGGRESTSKSRTPVLQRIVGTPKPMIQYSTMSQETRRTLLTLAIGGLLVFVANASQAAATYNFTNFDGPNSGTNAGTGTNMNGIANN